MYVVAVSPDGGVVAAGDYSNQVVAYASADGAELWRKSAWRGKGAPFTWGLSFSGDGRTLAIGHWDGYAYLIDATAWQP